MQKVFLWVVAVIVVAGLAGGVYWIFRDKQVAALGPVSLRSTTNSAATQVAPSTEPDDGRSDEIGPSAPLTIAADDRSEEVAAFALQMHRRVDDLISQAPKMDLQTVTLAENQLPNSALPMLETAMETKKDVPAMKPLTDALNNDGVRLRCSIATAKTIEWFTNTTLVPFENRDENTWARHAARVTLVASINNWADAPRGTGDEDSIVWREALVGNNAGCADPIFYYAWVSTMQDRFQADPKWARPLAQLTAKSMDATRDYSDYWKTMADLRAAKAILNDTEFDDKNNEFDALMSRAQARLPAIFADAEIPQQALLNLFKLLGQISQQKYQDRGKLSLPALALLEKSTSAPSVANAVNGEFYLMYSRDAGDGQSFDSMPADQHKLVYSRLEIARSSFEQAWKLDPSNVYAAAEMISALTVPETQRETMEFWYSRSQAAQPGNSMAVKNKLDYLSPYQRGSEQEMIRFGEQCRATNNWDEGLPYEWITAQVSVAQYETGYTGFANCGAYFKSHPELWNEIEAISEGEEKHRPFSSERTFMYARLACWYEKWPQAYAAFQKVQGPYNEWPFPKKEADLAYAEVLKHYNPATGVGITTRPMQAASPVTKVPVTQPSGPRSDGL